MIQGVIFEEILGKHEDDRRTLIPIFNADVKGFSKALQLKVLKGKKDSKLGGHKHRYAEIYSVIKGTVTFILSDQSGQTEEFKLVPGKRLLIPPFIYHEAMIEEGAVLLGLTEEKFVSEEANYVK